MSKSDAQRRSYLADQMTVMERVEAIERRVADLESSGTTRGPVRYLDPAGNIVDKGDPRRAPSPTECGRIVVDAGEWDRLQRIKQEAVRVVEMMARAKPTGGVWCGELVSLREAMK